MLQANQLRLFSSSLKDVAIISFVKKLWECSLLEYSAFEQKVWASMTHQSYCSYLVSTIDSLRSTALLPEDFLSRQAPPAPDCLVQRAHGQLARAFSLA